MSASLNATAWNFAIGLPNCLRSLAYACREVVRALSQPDAHRGDGDAAAVEDLEELLEALAARAEQVALGDPAVVERQPAGVGRLPAHLVERRRDR